MRINKIIIKIKIQFIKRIYLLIKLLPNQQNLIGDNQIIMIRKLKVNMTKNFQINKGLIKVK